MRIISMAALLTLALSGSFRSPAAVSSSLGPVAETVQYNDNRLASGTLAHSQLHVSLDARQAIWHPDGHGGGAIPIQAFAEAGKKPQIPGPLIRVPLGTIVVARVHNSIPGTVLTMHGLVNRPTNTDSVTRVPFGKTQIVRFKAGAPGTYLYWGTTSGKTMSNRFGWDSQLSGAFVVDASGSRISQNDRVFVITQWINVKTKTGGPDFNYELDAINGRGWPHTERLSYAQNQTVRWRWVNASQGTHPLHLHGYYFSVDSRGNGLADNLYASRPDRDREVTEILEPGGTFTMSWHVDRPGNWLFHCHLAYHIIGHMPIAAMLTGKATISDDEYENNYVRHAGMGGLILAFSVRPSESHNPIAAPPVAQRIRLKVVRGPDDRSDAPSFRYLVDEDGYSLTEPGAIGPPIILTRGVSTAIDVTNLLNEPTAVHWHGVELADSYYDGVVGLSGYGKRVAPMIDPGATFEVRMTPPRAGTFIYHTHMDDVWQLRGGLAGPLIVVEPGTRFDPSSDHVFTITTTHTIADALKIFVNGSSAPAAITAHVGVPQRFRFINMTTFWTNALVSLTDANHSLYWRPLQVDGAFVSPNRRRLESAVQTLTIGETRDFTFTPTDKGELQLQFLPDKEVPNVVTVPIHVVE